MAFPRAIYLFTARGKIDDFGQWNAKLNKFAKRTQQIRALNICMQRGCRGFPKWKCQPAYLPSHKAFDGASVGTVSLLAPSGAAVDGLKLNGLALEHHVHSCHASDLAIVDELEKLNGNFVSEEWMVHLIYIVAKGMPVTTEQCAGTRGERVETLRPSQVVEHKAMKRSSNVFFLSDDFKTRYPAALKALRHCVKLRDSQWTIKRGVPSRTDGKSAHCIKDAGDLWSKMQSMRYVLNSKYAPHVWRKGVPLVF